MIAKLKSQQPKGCDDDVQTESGRRFSIHIEVYSDPENDFAMR